MNRDCDNYIRRWPFTSDIDEENFVEPYDETEDVRPRLRDDEY